MMHGKKSIANITMDAQLDPFPMGKYPNLVHGLYDCNLSGKINWLQYVLTKPWIGLMDAKQHFYMFTNPLDLNSIYTNPPSTP